MACVTGVRDRSHDRGIVELLGGIDFIPSGTTAGVIVTEIPVILPNRADDIAFHDLHMIDIIKQTEILTAQDFAELDAPGTVIALVVGVIDLAVEKLHAKRQAKLLGERQQAAETDRTILETCLVRQSLAISGKTNHLLRPGGGSSLQVRLIDRDQGVMMGDAIE